MPITDLELVETSLTERPSEVSDPLISADHPWNPEVRAQSSDPLSATNRSSVNLRPGEALAAQALASITTEVDHTFALLAPAGEPYILDAETDDGKVQKKIAHPIRRRRGCGKYRHSLKTFIPCRCDDECEDENESRLDRVGLISFLLFSWLTRLMWRSYKRGLRLQDMWKISQFDSCAQTTERLARIWQEELTKHGKSNASFFRACWTFCKTRLIAAGLLFWMCLCFGFLGPTLFVQKLIQNAQNNDHSWNAVSYGLTLVLGLALSELSRSIVFVGMWAINYRTCVRLKSACSGLIYQKIFELNNVQQDGSSSAMVNLISSDVNKIFDAVRQCLLMIGGPILMVGGTVYSVWLLGPIAFVGAAVLILFYPVQAGLSRTLATLRRKSVFETDARIHLMTEIINSIRLIKMYAWEGPFCEKIAKMRENELKHLSMTSWTQSMNLSLTPLVPVIAAVVTFLSHMAIGGELEPTQAFTLLTIYYSTRTAYNGTPFALHGYADCLPSCERFKAFNIMIIFYIVGSGGLRQIVMSFLPIIAMRIACARVQNFLITAPIRHNVSKTSGPTMAIQLESVTCSWDPFLEHRPELSETGAMQSTPGVSTPALVDISMNVPIGSLVGLCGQVGCGKSSLFHGLLGQIYSSGLKFAMRGRLAYVAQQAWLVNDTVRENICFGEAYEYERYNEVVNICSLIYDFAVLANGDQTVIGERGATLSGGQRQRISLARAVYSNRDIFLLDDPLSAVDATVGAAIFEKCIYSYLRAKGKTVLLVSGQIQYIERCDAINVFKAGYIVQTGSHKELMNDETGEYYQLLKAGQNDRKSLEETIQETTVAIGDVPGALQPTVNFPEATPKLASVEAEDIKKGAVTMRTYARYIKAIGGYFPAFLVFIMFAVNMGLNTFSSWWLSYWFNHGAITRNVTMSDNSTETVNFVTLKTETAWYPAIYGGAILLVVLISIARSFVFMKVTLKAARRIHKNVFRSLMGGTMRFFDTTTAGKILNRLSKDVDEIDSQIPFVVEIFLQNGLYCFFALLNVAIIFPWLILAITILAIVFVIITQCFRSGVRDFKRLENNTSSPILTLAASTVQGLSTIQAYNRQDDLISRFQVLVDINSFPTFCFHCAIRWLGIRLDFLTIGFTVCTALFIVLLPQHVSAAEAGLTLSFAIQMSGLFQYTVRLALETEGRFTSLERLAEYIDHIPQEAKPKAEEHVSEHWPDAGRIVMNDVVLRYDVSLAPALRGINLVVEPAQHIGIVGRTGSGKSSIAAALFRSVEIEQGHIVIDGYDTKSISPQTLRSRLSIIPQDPVLFAGSLRYNLDPFEQYSEEQIWAALEKVNLKDITSALEGRLQYHVTQNGGNFSVGERQLICMARALLRKSRILFMDEATASIDSRTDRLLQQTIRTAFQKCTMLTVAHRLNTVITYDKILVVSEGKVVEFDTPDNLIADNNSLFSQMINSRLNAQ